MQPPRPSRSARPWPRRRSRPGRRPGGPSSAGPPWAPAPEPGRKFGPLPSVPNSALGPDPGPGIRVPGDMATMPVVPPDAMLPAPFDVSASPDPDFPPRPAPDGERPGRACRPGRASASPRPRSRSTTRRRRPRTSPCPHARRAWYSAPIPPRPVRRPPRAQMPGRPGRRLGPGRRRAAGTPASSGTWPPRTCSRPPPIPARRQRRRAPSERTAIPAPAESRCRPSRRPPPRPGGPARARARARARRGRRPWCARPASRAPRPGHRPGPARSAAG